MNDKEVQETTTCEWIKIDDFTEVKCNAESVEELLDNVQEHFMYRCNLLLSKLANEIGMKMMDKSNDSFEVWNDAQLFGG